MNRSCLLYTFLAASLSAMPGCSGGDEAAGAPAEDFMEVSLDGQQIPTESDPMSIATFGETFFAMGMQAPAPGGGFLDDNLVINVSTNGIEEGTYAFAREIDLRDLREAGNRGGTAAVFDFDGTEYESTLEGSVTLDGISTGTDEDGRPSLRWVRGSFSGTLVSEAGVERTASVRFGYVNID